jgi:hypothetical protein
MVKKTIDMKFKRKHKHNIECTQFICTYQDFQELLDKNCHLAIFPEERGLEFDAYWQGIKEVNEKNQLIYLQIKYSEGPIKGDKVVEYELPLNGQIKISDLQKGKRKEYFFDQ